MLKRIYEKSEVWFAVLFIIVYVVGNSFMIQASNNVGYEMVYTIPFNLLFLIVIFLFVKKLNLQEYYGLCKVKINSRYLLYYIPLIIIATVNVWMGFCFNMDPVRTIIYFSAMILTGIAEEMIFRGFLFRAMSRNNIKTAIIVTSILFGAGHIVNIINGNSDNTFETVCQMFYAVAIGFLLVAVLHVGKSIIPCIVTHSILNALSTFANNEAFNNIQIQVSIALCVISGVSAFAIFQNGKKEICKID